ncbi:MAG: SAM-dependent methyltransferase [Nitrospira sp.]|nr:SAM-dependent methyltransferase [Nitrospira sp.]
MPTKGSQQNARASRTSGSLPDRKGTLYVVAASIGHPDDVTLRAIQVLRNVDLIASEDPKATQQLLAHHHIQAMVTSYGPRNLKEKAAVLVQRLQRGTDVALVSDCGSPLVVDPGHLLVVAAHAHGIPVVPLPGPSVAIAALTAAGVPCESFYLLGYLPSKTPHLARCLIDALKREVPTVAFCPVNSLLRAVQLLVNIAPRRLVVLACDLTMSSEHIIRGTSLQVSRCLPNVQGEQITIVLAGKNRGGRDTKPRPV